MSGDRRRTQRELVLELLADGLEHTSIEFVDAGILRAGARIFELRRAGHAIGTRKISRRGQPPLYSYRLLADVDATSTVAAAAVENLDAGAGAKVAERDCFIDGCPEAVAGRYAGQWFCPGHLEEQAA